MACFEWRNGMKFIVGLLSITLSLNCFAQFSVPPRPESCPSLLEIRMVGFRHAVSTLDPEDGWFVYTWNKKLGTSELWGISMIVAGNDIKSYKDAIVYANEILYGIGYGLKLYYGPDYWDGKYNLWNCKYQTDERYHETINVMTPPPDINIFTKSHLFTFSYRYF